MKMTYQNKRINLSSTRHQKLKKNTTAIVVSLICSLNFSLAASTTVTTFAQLQSALQGGGFDTIILGANIDMTAAIAVNLSAGNPNVTINGQGLYGIDTHGDLNFTINNQATGAFKLTNMTYLRTANLQNNTIVHVLDNTTSKVDVIIDDIDCAAS